MTLIYHHRYDLFRIRALATETHNKDYTELINKSYSMEVSYGILSSEGVN